MDACTTYTMSTNEDTGINLIKTFDTSEFNISTQNCNVKSKRFKKVLQENISQNVVFLSNDSFFKQLKNELAHVENKSTNKAKKQPVLKQFGENKLNKLAENVFTKDIICDNTAKLTLAREKSHAHLQPYQNNIENTYSTASAFSLSSSNRLSDNANKSICCHYKNLGSSIAHSNDSKAIALQLTIQHSLPIYNLQDSLFNNYMKLSALITLESSRGIAQDGLSSQLNVKLCPSPTFNIAVGDLIGQLFKIPSNINKYLAGEPKCCIHQLHLNVLQMVGTVTGECLQNKNLDSGAKYALSNSTEKALSSTNEILGYSGIVYEKETPKRLVNQTNYASFWLFKKYNKQVISTIFIGKYFPNNTDFIQVQQEAEPKSLKLASKCNEVKDSMLLQDNVPTLFSMNSDEINVQYQFCNDNSFKNENLFNTPASLVEINCEVLSLEQSDQNVQVFNTKRKLLLSDSVIANKVARKENSLSRLRRDVICNKNQQFKKLKLSAECHTLSKQITNGLPQIMSGEIFTSDASSDCKIHCCSPIVVQFPTLPEEVENSLEANNSSGSSLSLQPLLKGVETVSINSFGQSKSGESTICDSSICQPIKIDMNKKLRNEQQLLDTLSKTCVESDPCKQLKERTYPTNAHRNQLPEENRIYLLSQNVSKEPLMYTAEISLEVLNIIELYRKRALDRSNKVEREFDKKINFSGDLNSNRLFKTDFSIPSSSDDLTNNAIAFNRASVDKAIQFDGEPLIAEDFDSEIDKAIDDSINKYENLMCDKGVLATPDTSDKSSQTDTISKEKQLACKRCLKFDDEDFGLYKKSKTYHKSSEEANLFNCEQVGTSFSTELMSYKTNDLDSAYIYGNDSNNHSNFIGGLPRHLLLTVPTNSIPFINKDEMDNFNTDSLHSGNSNVNDEFSLYDDHMNVEDGLSGLKDSKEMYGNEPVLYDHKVPVVTGKSPTAVMLKSPSLFLKTPKKPILKVGLSRSAKLKPLHHK